MKRCIIMQEKDMVATALEHIHPGDEVNVYTPYHCHMCTLEAQDVIPFGNKIALTDIATGEQVVKYNAIIGECVKPIAKGQLVHVHNVKSLSVDIPITFKKEIMRQMGINGD